MGARCPSEWLIRGVSVRRTRAVGNGRLDGTNSLVLTVVELVRQLMERQALRRIDVGDLSSEQVERLGTTLMALEEHMGELRDHFDLSPDDLNIDLGPLGSLLSSD